MGDFLLDLRPPAQRRLAKARELLTFTKQSHGCVMDQPGWGLVLVSTDDQDLWGPYLTPDGTSVVISGRVALDEPQWKAAESLPGEGGLASKAVYRIFKDQGIHGLEQLGGNYAILIYHHAVGEFHLITDAPGAFPVFRIDDEQNLVFGSHPDVLAIAAGVANDFDEVAMTEFLLTSTVTPPSTFYRRVKVMENGTVTSFALTSDGPSSAKTRKYYEITLKLDPDATEEDLAEDLAKAFRISVKRRTLPRLGRTAVALSGGLDSRAILACIENREQTFSFCCYNEPNRELAVAEGIAKAQNIEFFPWQRSFDYYGDSAEMGVRISGGMGTFANNHFLGLLDRLQEQGAKNLLTGCYCDYLFKGLPLNRTYHWLTGREQLAPFQHQFYFDHYLRQTPLANQIRERIESRVPAEFQSQDTSEKVFQVEAHRTFPLCYEGDNQQRVVPQRVTGWYLPMADRNIMDVYGKIPWQYKLNRSVYTKAVRKLCQGQLARVPDANTGARVGAPAAVQCVTANWARLKRKFRLKQSIGTDGSWPDWHYYVRNSKRLDDLWQRPNPGATDFFRRVLSSEDIRPHAASYQGRDTFFFVSLLTMKLWFDQWHT